MELDLAQKVGTPFVVKDVKGTFYDLAIGPGARRMVVATPGVLDKQYGFSWYYTPSEKPEYTREDAAKALVNQFRFSLIDHRSFLLSQGRLDNRGRDTQSVPANTILENAANRVCSDREYEVQ